MKEIVLFGAGGHCYAVIELIRSLGEFIPSKIIDDNPETNSILGLDVLLAEEKHITEIMCITIGNNRVRKKIAEMYASDYPSFIHRTAVVYPSVTIGEGTMIHPLAVLDADVSIGKHCIINNHSTVSHNSVVGDYAHIAIQATIAGGVKIGEGVLVGAGSVILPNVEIGEWSTIGAGAVVSKSIAPYTTVVGIPAKPLKK